MNKQKAVAVAALVAILGITSFYILSSNGSGAKEPVAAVQTAATKSPAAATREEAAAAVLAETAAEAPAETAAEPSPVTETPEAAAPAANIDLAAALSERSLGNADAPVLIEEFASLTCGHCAHFHKDVFPKIKEAYIDTGKIRFVFNDFPLNAPAMDGSMLARCMPQDQYFKFIKFLFENQNEWAFSADYQKKLKQNAKLLGADDAMMDACLGNAELKTGLAARMQQATEKHEIKSTPSFVLNGKEVIQGARSFESFQQAIDKSLEEGHKTE